MSRLTAEWFAAASLNRAARIQLNYNDAIRAGGGRLQRDALPMKPPRRSPRLLSPCGRCVPRCGVRWASPTAPAISMATRHVDVLWALRAAATPA